MGVQGGGMGWQEGEVGKEGQGKEAGTVRQSVAEALGLKILPPAIR